MPNSIGIRTPYDKSATFLRTSFCDLGRLLETRIFYINVRLLFALSLPSCTNAPFSVDPSKLNIAFQLMGVGESPPILPTESLTMSDPSPTPFVVTEALSKVYYKGLPSQPLLITTTKTPPSKVQLASTPTLSSKGLGS